ncbi:MAG TPA: cupin domain-containing protein [Blastocatellia bacterium]|nr:cupin domain-containing protein [Blastocatellia bacterium]
MKHHKLNEVPVEHVTDLFSRQFFTGEKITMAFLTIKQGCVVPTHSHDSEQFSYIISGALHFNIGGEEVTVRAGELVEIPSHVPHSAVATEDTTGIDVFSPIRADWRDGTDDYLRRS